MYEEQLDAFGTWLHDISANAAELQEVENDDLGNALQKVHLFIQEHGEKKPNVESIRQKLQATITADQSPSNPMVAQFTDVEKKFQTLAIQFESKKLALEKCKAFNDWYVGVNELVPHLKYQVETSQQPGPLNAALDKCWADVNAHEAEFKEMQKLLKEASVTVKFPDEPVIVMHDTKALIDNLRLEIAKKCEKEKVVEKQKSYFNESKARFAKELSECEADLKNAVSRINNPEKLKSGLAELIKLEGRFSQANSLKEDLQKKGNALIKEDESSMLEVQNSLTTVFNDWDNLNDQLRQEIDAYRNLQQALISFNVIKTETVALVEEFERALADTARSPNDLTEAYIIKENCKTLSDKINGSKNYIDKIENSGKNIVKSAKSIPQFDITRIEAETKECCKKWADIADLVKKRVEGSEAEIVLWQQIDESKNYLLPWLRETNEDLCNLLANLTDVNVAQAKLKSYEDQLGINENLKRGIIAKRDQLVKLNNGKPNQNLDSLVNVLNEEFKELENVSQQLGNLVNACDVKEKSLKEGLKNATIDLNAIREKSIKCDDLTGDIGLICERLVTCKETQKNLKEIQPKITNMEKLAADIAILNPSYVNSSAVKELNAFKTRFSDVSGKLDKTENALIFFVNKNFKDKLLCLKDSVDAYGNKVSWCLPEENFDLDHLNSKLSTLLEVEDDLRKLDGKKREIEHTFELLNKINCDEINKEIIPLKENIFADLNAINKEVGKTKAILKKYIELTGGYDTNYNKIVSALNAIEEKVKLKSRDLIDTEKIKENIKKLEELEPETKAILSDIDQLKATEKALSKLENKAKVHSISPLEEKARLISDYLASRLNRLHNVEDLFAKYEKKVKHAEDYLKDANVQLAQLESVLAQQTKDTEFLKAKLKELKDFSQTKDAAISLINELTELCEPLLVELVVETRDTIKSKLKALRNAADALTDKWTSLVKNTENDVLQRASIEDSRKQVLQWLTNVENKIEPVLQLKEGLPEKKKALNTYRVLLQDVQSHKPIVEQLVNKMKSIPEAEADQLSQKYDRLQSIIADSLNVFDKQVANHELYLNSFEKLKDFVDVLSSEEGKCGKCDVDSQIGIYESIIQQEKNGNEMVTECERLLRPVLSETNDTGKVTLTADLNAQKQNWLQFMEKCKSTLKNLTVKKDLAEKLQGSVSSLEEILKDAENKFKDQSLKPSLCAKKLYLEEVKSILQNLNYRNADFESLKNQVSGANPELTEVVMKLLNRYQNVKIKAKVGII